MSCCTSALVVVLPEPWVPLSHTIMALTLASREPHGRAEQKILAAHRRFSIFGVGGRSGRPCAYSARWAGS